MNVKKIAIYIRVSSREQAINGFGLDVQEEKCRNYIQLFHDSKDENIVIYKDDGYSAKSLNRPMMKKLLYDVEIGKIKKVIAYKLDRLSRNVIDTYDLILKLQQYNCDLVAILDNLDITSANGRMFVGMLSVIAQWEREVISERTLDGMQAMAKQGKYPFGNVSYGWFRDENQYLQIDNKAAEVLNKAADLLLVGHSLPYISDILKIKYGVDKSPRQLKTALKNKRIIGKFLYHGIEYDNVIPAIMNIEKFSELQTALKYREIHSPRKVNYFFHGMVYCSCGRRMDHSSSNKGDYIYYYYYCKKCRKMINQEKIFKMIIRSVCEESKRVRESKFFQLKTNKIKELEKEIDNLFCMYRKKKISANIFMSYTSKLQNELDDIKNLEYLFENDPSSIKASDNKSKFNFFEVLISRIIIDPNTKKVIEIIYKSE